MIKVGPIPSAHERQALTKYFTSCTEAKNHSQWSKPGLRSQNLRLRRVMSRWRPFSLFLGLVDGIKSLLRLFLFIRRIDMKHRAQIVQMSLFLVTELFSHTLVRFPRKWAGPLIYQWVCLA